EANGHCVVRWEERQNLTMEPERPHGVLGCDRNDRSVDRPSLAGRCYFGCHGGPRMVEPPEQAVCRVQVGARCLGRITDVVRRDDTISVGTDAVVDDELAQSDEIVAGRHLPTSCPQLWADRS